MAKDFVNSEFDDPMLANLAYDVSPFHEGRRLYGLAQDLIKGWTVTDGGKPYSGLVAYGIGLDGGIPYPGLQMSLKANQFTIGSYSIEFTSFVSGIQGSQPPDVVISQVGTVPQNAYYLTGVGYAKASIDGNRLTEARPNDFLLPYWDVHEYAGKEVTLSFTFHGGGRGESVPLDIIGFTVPEPSTWALLAVGGLVLGVGCRPRKG